MTMLFRKIKQVSVALALSTLIAAPAARADSVDVPYLTNIQNYTNSILTVVNQLPTYLTELANMATSMMATDNSTSDPINWSTNWTNEQTWLSTLGTDALTNAASQATLQQSLLNSFFGSANITAGNPQNINDLSYTTLLGQPLLTPDPRSGVNASMNYLTNASGLSMKFPIPGSGWRGSQAAQQSYIQFYNTVTAVQTYNGYVLSRLYEDSQTLTNDTSLRTQLITQSTNSDWFSSIIANDLGWVLRQILLYTSQSYVLLDQLVQIQKQMSASIAMSNALLVANSSFQANALVTKAQGSTG